MAHQAIYRRWRPLTFDDIVGQPHITKTLKNQIISGTTGHAYLFCGTRGTGKTTCAKVFSRAVNCLNPVNGNPCNECEVCRGLLDGSIMDVTEMDAASNNSVDDIREIKTDINYVSSRAKYTVYIIDEVHMLSNSAFNALLKTLEEPPENVIFILATTESHKVPQTILSRCQRFDFRRIRNEDIVLRMKEIAHADGYRIDDAAFRMLAGLADGSLRDGLSIMERVISAAGDNITVDDIINTLGISPQETVSELTDAVIRGDGAEVIGVIERVLREGRDLNQLAESMLGHFRELMVCKVSDKPEELLDCDADTLVKIKAQSEKMTFEKINHASCVISEAIADAKASGSQRIVYELAYLKLTRPEMDNSQASVMDRLSAVEQKLINGVPQAAAPQQSYNNTYDINDLIRRIEALEKALQEGIKLEPKKVSANEGGAEFQKKKKSSKFYVPIPIEELHYDHPIAKLARSWTATVEAMVKMKNPYVFPLNKCSITFDAEGIVVLIPDDANSKFTMETILSHKEEIRESFEQAVGSGYTLKFAKNGTVDESMRLNPFSLPRFSNGQPPARAAMPDDGDTLTEEPAVTAEEEEHLPENGDKLAAFVEKFSGFIVNTDKMSGGIDRDIIAGEQELLSDTDDDDDDDSEEFLEESELSSEEAEDN